MEPYPKDLVKLGRWLGVAHSVGNAMIYWILKGNGMIVPRSTVRPLTEDEKKNQVEIENRKKYKEMIHTKFGEYNPEELELFENDKM